MNIVHTAIRAISNCWGHFHDRREKGGVRISFSRLKTLGFSWAPYSLYTTIKNIHITWEHCRWKYLPKWTKTMRASHFEWFVLQQQRMEASIEKLIQSVNQAILAFVHFWPTHLQQTFDTCNLEEVPLICLDFIHYYACLFSSDSEVPHCWSPSSPASKSAHSCWLICSVEIGKPHLSNLYFDWRKFWSKQLLLQHSAVWYQAMTHSQNRVLVY